MEPEKVLDGENKLTEETKVAEETKSVEENKPVAETKPAEETIEKEKTEGKNAESGTDEKKWLWIVIPSVTILIVCGVLFGVFFGFVKPRQQVSGPEDFAGEDGNFDELAGNGVSTGSSNGNVLEGSGNTGGENSNSGSTGNNGNYGTSAINTGNLTENNYTYEGTVGTGDYNYGEALQLSLLFYELQRSGDLPEQTRCNWRGDSGLNDGSDAGIDLTGGWYDAGDHVKFNLPMAYTAAMLGWSLYEDRDAYIESGQLVYMLEDLRWVNDYLMKCHPEDNVFYYQVGNGGIDHSWWGPAEVMQMERPSYCVTLDSPGSTVVGEAAAALAVAGIVFEEEDREYSQLCLSHAKSLFNFAEQTKSDSGYTAADGFYTSNSGFYDELSWAATWLYLATGESSYLDKACEYYAQANQDYIWAQCWDDVHYGAALLLARITGDSVYKEAIETHLDFWTVGTASGERITYTPQGLAWLDMWGSLRYATTTAFLASVYSEWDGCSAEKSQIYWDFAVAQANYALGSTGFSYLIGYGDQYPEHPHHRTAQGSYCNNMNEPAQARHTLYGALVGGPDAGDNYTDEVSNYTTNEVACDYNAGFTGLMANLYSVYHGQTRVDFGAVEPVGCAELYAETGINVEGNDFVEIKAYIYNVSAWPARVPENLEYRYFVDLSECYAAGGSVDDIEITTNYMQAGNATGLYVWNEEEHIYYLSIDFSGALIYPGGQENFKKEIQVRLRNPQGTWDNSNDPSFAGLSTGSVVMSENVALYENGVLIFGSEPTPGSGVAPGTTGNSTDANATGNADGSTDSSSNEGQNGNTSSGNGGASGQNAEGDGVRVGISYSNIQSSTSSIAGTIKITNSGNSNLNLANLSIEYYFTKDGDASLNFSCYNASINSSSGGYQGISGVNGSFRSTSGNNTDTCCTMTIAGSNSLASGDTLTIDFCINKSDWSNFNTTNDYSLENVEHIVIRDGQRIIFGEEP